MSFGERLAHPHQILVVLPARRALVIIIHEYLEAGLTASISVQHIYCRHELGQQQEL